MQKVSLTREVNGNVRYYKLILFQTLFGEYGVERIYGAQRNRKPTGHKYDFFDTIDIANKFFNRLLKTKQAKGYSKLH